MFASDTYKANRKKKYYKTFKMMQVWNLAQMILK